MQQSLYITITLCIFYRCVDIIFHTWKTHKVSIYQLLRLCTRHTQSLRQSECRYTIYDTKIRRFCLTTHIARHLLNWHFIYIRRRCRVDVVVGIERRQHILILRQMRHQS